MEQHCWNETARSWLATCATYNLFYQTDFEKKLWELEQTAHMEKLKSTFAQKVKNNLKLCVEPKVYYLLSY